MAGCGPEHLWGLPPLSTCVCSRPGENDDIGRDSPDVAPIGRGGQGLDGRSGQARRPTGTLAVVSQPLCGGLRRPRTGGRGRTGETARRRRLLRPVTRAPGCTSRRDPVAPRVGRCTAGPSTGPSCQGVVLSGFGWLYCTGRRGRYNSFWGRGKCEPPAPVLPALDARADRSDPIGGPVTRTPRPAPGVSKSGHYPIAARLHNGRTSSHEGGLRAPKSAAVVPSGSRPRAP